MKDFYPAVNVTVFGDIAMKEEMVLTWGLSGGLSFNMTGVLRRREAWTHEQIPEENMHRAKAMGTQLEGSHLQAKETQPANTCILHFQHPELQENSLLSKPSQTVLFVMAAPSKPMPLSSLQRHFTHRCLAAPET